MKRKKSRHFAEEFLQNKKNLYICNPKRNKRFRNGERSFKRCGSSAWLEYMPVTHGVAGSSPVRTAINAKNQQVAERTPDFTPKNVKSGVLFYLRFSSAIST